MRILDRYIVREVSRHAFLGLIVFTFVFLVPRLVRLMEIYVRHVGSGAQILKLFLCIFPGVFVFTLPMATLIGVLLGLGRMSADSEIIALTSLGIGRRRILFPVGMLALVGGLLTLIMTAWVGPAALRTLHAAEAQLISSQISFQVQPLPNRSRASWSCICKAEPGMSFRARTRIIIRSHRLGKATGRLR